MALRFPGLNPVTFNEEKISAFEQAGEPFCQNWKPGDTIVFQMAYEKMYPETAGFTASLVDDCGREAGLFARQIMQAGEQWQARYSCVCGDEGFFRIKLVSELGNMELFSNRFCVEERENTLLLSYSHRTNKAGCVFTAEGWTPFFLRLEGGVTTDKVSLQSDDVFYTAQDGTVYLVDSIPKVTTKYAFGMAEGIPLWMAEKLNRVFGCDRVEIDGKRVVKNDGAKVETTVQSGYPYVGVLLELVSDHRNGDAETEFRQEFPVRSKLIACFDRISGGKLLDRVGGYEAKVYSFSLDFPKITGADVFSKDNRTYWTAKIADYGTGWDYSELSGCNTLRYATEECRRSLFFRDSDGKTLESSLPIMVYKPLSDDEVAEVLRYLDGCYYLTGENWEVTLPPGIPQESLLTVGKPSAANPSYVTDNSKLR